MQLASAVFDVKRCLSVRLSRSGIVSINQSINQFLGWPK